MSALIFICTHFLKEIFFFSQFHMFIKAEKVFLLSHSLALSHPLLKKITKVE